MKRIPLSQELFALVDDNDYTRVSKYRWWAVKQGKTYYAHRHITKAAYRYTRQTMHRFIMRPGSKEVVDHIDRDGLNNTRANLRIATHAQNHRNAPANVNNSSGFKGVHKRKNSIKWIAQIRDTSGRRVYLGDYFTPEDAARAYDAAAVKYHGEFAQLNFSVSNSDQQ